MTQDEVDLIYDYLHENYRYDDGELIRIKKLGKWVKGTALGTLFHREGARFEIRSGIRVSGKTYSLPISKFIYIFHHKIYPHYVDFLDGNPTNTRIENLTDAKRRNAQIHQKNKGYTIVKTKNGDRYRATIYMRNKNVSLGQYSSSEMASSIYEFALDLALNTNLGIDEIKLKISENFSEYKLFIKNKTGYRGVSCRPNNKYAAQITVNYKTKYVGVFNTPEEAHEAHLKAKKEFNKS